ncbi:MAG: hypothetical protein COB67_12850 [SAR324 cluster bacterium]|uniref:Bifunctional NAD(P)H-hydrate repair enzyme n=1 Tax=SAR324 cluster bacterium TaxID=2024889 RepID=A0A2A4SQM7_9DELT|nr:MAG: hypothetical protein COB67_12850 [SAR324 cluster bacterium]
MRLVDSQQMQIMDRYTIDEVGIPGLVLMENAARSWFAAAIPYLTKAQHIYVLCGSGNNGGDGYAIARILVNHGYDCSVIAVKKPKSQDCRMNAKIWSHFGETLSWSEMTTQISLRKGTFSWIDAILGTGISTPIQGELRERMDTINQLPGSKIGVDVPSGINSSTGDIMGVALQMDATITFQKEKVGHHLYPGKQYSGIVICRQISILEYFPKMAQEFHLIDEALVEKLLPQRTPTGYKNQFGHLITWGGRAGTMGASWMASYAGLKIGAGLSTAAIPQSEQSVFWQQAPELMTYPQEQITGDWLNHFDALVLGCGLGREENKWAGIQKILHQANLPYVLDADAFYGIQDWKKLSLDQAILTPHPGEFAQISGYPKPRNNEERMEQGLAFVRKYPTTLVLKGAPSLVFSSKGDLYINSTGNVGMATAGSGDVLAGFLGGLLAQGLAPLQAALLGTWLHGKSGDLAKEQAGEAALTATDLIRNLGKVLKGLQPSS